MRSSTTTTRTRFAIRALVAAVAVIALTSACANDEDKGGAGDFAAAEDKGGSGSVTLIEQPWIDLQVENEISKQLLTKLGYTVKVDSVSVELGAQALSTGDADAYLGNWWPSQEPTYGSLIDGKKVEVKSTLMTGTEYAPAVPGDTADELGIKSLADLDKHADAFDRKIYGIEAGSPGNETIQKAIDADAYGSVTGNWSRAVHRPCSPRWRSRSRPVSRSSSWPGARTG